MDGPLLDFLPAVITLEWLGVRVMSVMQDMDDDRGVVVVLPGGDIGRFIADADAVSTDVGIVNWAVVTATIVRGVEA